MSNISNNSNNHNHNTNITCNISHSDNYPNTFNAIIEITQDSPPVKYEFCEKKQMLKVDRFINVAMTYPCNYGFIPNTKGGDGDPLDILVITKYPLINNCVIEVKIVGMLKMEDEKGMDEKLIAVPDNEIDNSYSGVNDIDDIEHNIKEKISHFFSHYKDLEKKKFVKIIGWADQNEALKILKKSIIDA